MPMTFFQDETRSPQLSRKRRRRMMQLRSLDAVVVATKEVSKVEAVNKGEVASKEEVEISVVDLGSADVASQRLVAMATLHVLAEVVAGPVLRKTRLCGCIL
jgi:hypothetical protein